MFTLVAATMIAAQTIQSGSNDIVVTGGMESMSNVPKYLPQARFDFLVLIIVGIWIIMK